MLGKRDIGFKCRKNEDCKPKLVCKDNKCVECHTDDDCPLGLFCKNKKCKENKSKRAQLRADQIRRHQQAIEQQEESARKQHRNFMPGYIPVEGGPQRTDNTEYNPVGEGDPTIQREVELVETNSKAPLSVNALSELHGAPPLLGPPLRGITSTSGAESPSAINSNNSSSPRSGKRTRRKKPPANKKKKRKSKASRKKKRN